MDTPVNWTKQRLHRGGLRLADRLGASPMRHRVLVAIDRLIGTAVYDVDGLRLRLSPRPLIDRYLIEQGSYAPELVAEVRSRLARGGHFIDVGANIGYLTLVGARALGPRGCVFSFEPSPSEFHSLLEHLRLNAVTNVVPYPFALGEAPTGGTLYLAGRDNPGMNSRVRPLGAPVAIEVRPLHALLPPEILRDVSLVKIDVEGDELSVLLGFEAAMMHLHRAMFIVEVSPALLSEAGRSADELYAFFRRHGWTSRGPAFRDAAQWDEVFSPPTSA